LPLGPEIGSLLLSALFLVAAGMSLPSIRLIKRYGYGPLLVANYMAVVLFLLSHLYASIYTLLPAYLLLGVTISGSAGSKASLIVHFGGKLSCSCESQPSQAAVDVLHEEHKMFCNRDQKVRRLARWFRVSQDLGLIGGALLASILLACSDGDFTGDCSGLVYYGNESWPPQLRDFYNRNEHGDRICGADMCPLRVQSLLAGGWANGSSIPSSIYAGFIESEPRVAGQSLLWLYVLFAVISLVLSLVIMVDKVQATGSSRPERLRDVSITDTLLFAGPLAYFVGTEQAYMLGDFLRAFVTCSLGIGMIAGALIGMGLMQLIVSCTLSMLLRHVKRIVVICEYYLRGTIPDGVLITWLPFSVAGFFFHSCLLLALSSWKPSSDDSALFYVIAASWGACNGMWETLLLSLVTLNHASHVTEVQAPLLALRFLGLGLTFAGHGFLCESMKIIALVVLLVISVPPYATLEIRLEAQRKATLVSL